MRRQTVDRGTAACAAAALLFAGMTGSARAAEPGVPFPLRPGQSAMLGSGMRVSLISVTPAGECPGGHSECVEVAPPQAEVDFDAPPAPSAHLVLPLLGRTSPPRQSAAWTLRAVDLAPFPFSAADVAAGRVAVTFLLSAAEPRR